MTVGRLAQFENVKACVFDAYGTLFDVHSAVRLKLCLPRELDLASVGLLQLFALGVVVDHQCGRRSPG